MTPKTVVIHHNADFDGIFCRKIALKFLPDAELIGWDFGDNPVPPQPPGTKIYILDLPVDRVFGFNFAKEGVSQSADFKDVVWIDHHASSIASHPTDIPGYRIDGVAACRLAWQWFTIVDGNTPRVGAEIGIPIRPAGVLPMVQDFKNREVNEPLAVRLAGEYDVHDLRYPDAELLQFGLRSVELTPLWDTLLSLPSRENQQGMNTVSCLLYDGVKLQFARDNEYREVIQQQGFDVQFEGLTFLACCSHELDIRSQLFVEGIRDHHQALLGFTYTGHDWRVSMYHAPGNEHHDLSKIAVKYGGGGHRGACGFRVKTLPFAL